MEDLTPPTVSSDSTAHVKKGSRSKGTGAKVRSELKFRQKKNDQFQAELQASLLRRLKISDPTNVSAINLQSSIVPARIPISLRGLPTFVHELWLRMKSIGTRPFQNLCTPQNYAIFLKCVMCIAEAKICYSQMKCEVVPPFPLTSLHTFTEMQLRSLNSIAKRLPFPIVIFLEAIGIFTADKQPVVPILASASPNVLSGAVSFAPSNIGTLLAALREDVQVTDLVYTVGQELRELPMINWVVREIPERVEAEETIPAHSVGHVAQDSIEFWSGPPTPRERLIFEQIIATMEIRKGFLLQTDISTGMGSIIQGIRFPDVFDPDEEETLYYMNTISPEFEEKLAPALLVGYEYRTEAFSRFCSNYTECLKHGTASATDARHAVIWADN